MQPHQIGLIRLQRLQGQQDQVIKIDRPAQGQTALIIGVDVEAGIEQRPRAALFLEVFRQFVGLSMQFLGQADQIIGDFAHIVLHKAADALKLLQVFGFDQRPQGVGVVGEKFAGGIFFDLARRVLVDDVEIFAQPDEAGAFAHDVMRQPVQRAHAIADARQQAACAQKLADAQAEVGDGAVGEGDDQHLALIAAPAAAVLFGHQPLHQFGGQQAEGVGLARAGHGADAHRPVCVGEDALLRRAQL